MICMINCVASTKFSEADAARVKEIESVTNHDVKAIEYFIKEKFDEIGGLDAFKEFIHLVLHHRISTILPSP